MSEQKTRAIETIKEYYGDLLLAIYERGSSLYNLKTNNSDYDLQVIVRTKKETLLMGKLYSDSIKLNDNEFDIAAIDEYKLINQVRRGIINTIEIFFKDPIYLNPDYKETAEFLKTHVHELIISHPVELMGGCYGYYRSYAKDLENSVMSINSEFPGKRFAMAMKSKNLSEVLINSPYDKEKLKSAIIPDSKLREELLFLKSTNLIGNHEQLMYFSRLKDELVDYLEVLDKTKREAIKITKIEPTDEYINKLVKLLLPPV